MSNVVTLSSVRARGIAAKHADIAAISRMFAQQRRRAGDVFWLKDRVAIGALGLAYALGRWGTIRSATR